MVHSNHNNKQSPTLAHSLHNYDILRSKNCINSRQSQRRLLDLYDEGQLPPDDIIEMAQQLIDIDLDDYLTQYQQFCDYCIVYGGGYDVEVGGHWRTVNLRRLQARKAV